MTKPQPKYEQCLKLESVVAGCEMGPRGGRESLSQECFYICFYVSKGVAARQVPNLLLFPEFAFLRAGRWQPVREESRPAM